MSYISCDQIPTIDPNNLVWKTNTFCGGYNKDKDNNIWGGVGASVKDAETKITSATQPKYCLKCKEDTTSNFEHIRKTKGETNKWYFYIITKCSKCHMSKATKIGNVDAELLIAAGKKKVEEVKNKRKPKSKQ